MWRRRLGFILVFAFIIPISSVLYASVLLPWCLSVLMSALALGPLHWPLPGRGGIHAKIYRGAFCRFSPPLRAVGQLLCKYLTIFPRCCSLSIVEPMSNGAGCLYSVWKFLFCCTAVSCQRIAEKACWMQAQALPCVTSLHWN